MGRPRAIQGEVDSRQKLAALNSVEIFEGGLAMAINQLMHYMEAGADRSLARWS